ncbi:MAG: hypothetical protein FWH38_09480 [Treponema sp.]|nr:hypothetical protein [Treponema sp.]
MTDDNAGEQSFLIGLEFQYALKDFLTLSLEPRFGIGNDLFFYGQGFGYGSNGVTFEDNYLWEESRVKYTLFTMNPGVLFRMPGSGLRGWYFGMYPTIGWKNASRDEYQGSPGVNDDFFILGITGGAGYQWIFKRGFTISLGHGLGRTWEIAGRGNTGIYDSSRRFLVDFIFNFKIGYSF